MLIPRQCGLLAACAGLSWMIAGPVWAQTMAVTVLRDVQAAYNTEPGGLLSGSIDIDRKVSREPGEWADSVGFAYDDGLASVAVSASQFGDVDWSRTDTDLMSNIKMSLTADAVMVDPGFESAGVRVRADSQSAMTVTAYEPLRASVTAEILVDLGDGPVDAASRCSASFRIWDGERRQFIESVDLVLTDRLADGHSGRLSVDTDLILQPGRYILGAIGEFNARSPEGVRTFPSAEVAFTLNAVPVPEPDLALLQLVALVALARRRRVAPGSARLQAELRA
jgi:hypothetical protein